MNQASAHVLQAMDGRPKRPLSAYNIFFKHERKQLLAERLADGSSTGVGFQNMTKTISARWNGLDEAAKEPFRRLARIEKSNQKKAVNEWKKQQRPAKKIKGDKIKNLLNNRISYPAQVIGSEMEQDPSDEGSNLFFTPEACASSTVFNSESFSTHSEQQHLQQLQYDKSISPPLPQGSYDRFSMFNAESSAIFELQQIHQLQQEECNVFPFQESYNPSTVFNTQSSSSLIAQQQLQQSQQQQQQQELANMLHGNTTQPNDDRMVFEDFIGTRVHPRQQEQEQQQQPQPQQHDSALVQFLRQKKKHSKQKGCLSPMLKRTMNSSISPLVAYNNNPNHFVSAATQFNDPIANQHDHQQNNCQGEFIFDDLCEPQDMLELTQSMGNDQVDWFTHAFNFN